MHKIEKLFDINIVLMTLFSSVETIREEKNIELIYDMEATIPRELRGDPDVLLRVLNKVLTFVCQNTDEKEIVLSLDAPEDFLYEEFISFTINDIHIEKEKIRQFLETDLHDAIEILEGEIVYEDDADIHINLPFKISELGHRRHYRLPDISMLGKKVLLICENEAIAHSIEKMFKYFLYDVDVGFDAFKAQGNDLTPYDILIVDDHLNTEEFEHLIARIQQNIPLKYVLLQDAHITERKMISVSTNLIKPVTEESVYELIISLFKIQTASREVRSHSKINTIDLEKYLQSNKDSEKSEEQSSAVQESLEAMIEKRRGMDLPILDRTIGEANIKHTGLTYAHELKTFLDTFDRSDLYFREIVNQRSINKIKEFCIDLERQAKLIGAESMFKLAETLSLIFVYDKLDMLPIYPGKYHIELQKLTEAIKKELQLK
ncbi:hypothetical protein MN086_08000 [Sulfurovum sp. XGS-02]|uniref:hypothetical protein n=1 Tax=Sulfurovum sp. XGS-02 TaxID=2925411 RepID=UPI002062928E|nr:hypothetical protein [Sulfurovum sp. XGS-02]UPT76995.1 hypothetical protein MN086_08000 [Sulfurovum sp. XGS-02]